MRKSLFASFAALLALGSAPAWSMQGACASRASGLACLRLCAKAKVLLSEGGRLPLLGAAACRVEARSAEEALLSRAELAPQDPGRLAPTTGPALQAPSAPPAWRSLAGRAPPLPPAFLACRQPSAQAPPALS